MTPRRVLVCGSNYGRSYVEAIRRAGGTYEVAGLFARGGARSRRLADRLGVPLLTDPDRLPPDIELACAALGLDGSDVVLRLLRRGLHVLCEHPQPPEFVRGALDAASTARRCFHVNGHFADLSASRAFIDRCRAARETTQPRFLQVTLADRFLYAGLDILARALGGVGPVTIDSARRAPPFTLVEGSFRSGIPVTVRIQPTRTPDGEMLAVGSREYVVSYRIEIGFPSGILTLLAPGGPVVWTANEHWIEDPEVPLWEPVYTKRVTGRSVIHERTALNARALRALADHARGGAAPPEQRPDHLLDVSDAWATLGEAVRVSVGQGSSGRDGAAS